MKRFLLLSLALVSCASTTELEEDMTVTPEERRAIVRKMMQMQDEIDKLEKKLETEKVRTGCA